MPTFSYNALDQSGAEVHGTIDAPNEEAAWGELQRQGHFVSKVQQVTEPKLKGELRIGRVPQRTDYAFPPPGWLAELQGDGTVRVHEAWWRRRGRPLGIFFASSIVVGGILAVVRFWIHLFGLPEWLFVIPLVVALLILVAVLSWAVSCRVERILNDDSLAVHSSSCFYRSTWTCRGATLRVWREVYRGPRPDWGPRVRYHVTVEGSGGKRGLCLERDAQVARAVAEYFSEKTGWPIYDETDEERT